MIMGVRVVEWGLKQSVYHFERLSASSVSFRSLEWVKSLMEPTVCHTHLSLIGTVLFQNGQKSMSDNSNNLNK